MFFPVDLKPQTGVAIRFLNDDISTESAMCKMVVIILLAVAQAERQHTKEKINEGRIEAKLLQNVAFFRNNLIEKLELNFCKSLKYKNGTWTRKI